MKKNIRKFGLSFLAASLISFSFSSCLKSNKDIMRMQKLETGVDSPTSEAELKAAIEKYQERVADIQLANAQVGTWYKMLAIRYLDAKMYGEALKNFQIALQYYPANQNLFYWTGVCASFMANASLDFEATGSTKDRDNYLKLAETSFLRAISLEPHHAKALFSIGVLYVWELHQFDKAIPYLETLCATQKKDTDAMTVLAAAYYGNLDYEKSIEMYDRIIATTKLESKKAEAMANKQIVMDKAYEK